MNERGITYQQVQDAIRRGRQIEHKNNIRRQCFLRNNIFVVYIPEEHVVVTVMCLEK